MSTVEATLEHQTPTSRSQQALAALASSPEQPEHAKYLIARLSCVIWADYYPNGERAALKRWAVGKSLPTAFFRLWLQHMGEHQDLPRSSDTENWAALIWGLAYSREGSHRPSIPLGQALAHADWPQARLERLLSADADLRVALFQDAQRFLAAKGQACDFSDWALYLLIRDPEQREAHNMRIASFYFRNSR